MSAGDLIQPVLRGEFYRNEPVTRDQWQSLASNQVFLYRSNQQGVVYNTGGTLTSTGLFYEDQPIYLGRPRQFATSQTERWNIQFRVYGSGGGQVRARISTTPGGSSSISSATLPAAEGWSNAPLVTRTTGGWQYLSFEVTTADPTKVFVVSYTWRYNVALTLLPK